MSSCAVEIHSASLLPTQWQICANTRKEERVVLHAPCQNRLHWHDKMHQEPAQLERPPLSPQTCQEPGKRQHFCHTAYVDVREGIVKYVSWGNLREQPYSWNIALTQVMEADWCIFLRSPDSLALSASLAPQGLTPLEMLTMRANFLRHALSNSIKINHHLKSQTMPQICFQPWAGFSSANQQPTLSYSIFFLFKELNGELFPNPKSTF